MKSNVALFCFLFLSFIQLSAQKGRIEKDLSNNDWKLWLDTTAQWESDVLYAPQTTPLQSSSNWVGRFAKNECKNSSSSCYG